MFTYNKQEGARTIIRAKVDYRVLVRYPQCTQLPCTIKGCLHKKKNGRCGLKETCLELDENDNLTGICLCYKARENVQNKPRRSSQDHV